MRPILLGLGLMSFFSMNTVKAFDTLDANSPILTSFTNECSIEKQDSSYDLYISNPQGKRVEDKSLSLDQSCLAVKDLYSEGLCQKVQEVTIQLCNEEGYNVLHQSQ